MIEVLSWNLPVGAEDNPDDVMDSEHLLHCPTLNHEAQQAKDLVSLY
jgi:hypothetical protein